MERARLQTAIQTATEREPVEPKEPEQFWVKASDISTQDVSAILHMHRSAHLLLDQPPEGKTAEELLEAYKSLEYADSYIGAGARIELRGKGPILENGPEFMRIKIRFANNKETSKVQETIDAYFKEKGINLIPLSATF
jgi:hypothetical protein